METTLPTIKRVVIAAHPDVPQAATLVDGISRFLIEHAIGESHGKIYDPEIRQAVRDGGIDLFIALGGDGTMLRAGHLCAPFNIPILGINLGRFGFLTAVQSEDWKATLEQVLAGDCWLERRMMLHAEHQRQDETLDAWGVVNECFVGRGNTMRPVHLVTEIDDHILTTYVADGLILATATGSTAYALAAGGPILPPQLRNILIVPVAPHLSMERAIVLDENSSVRVTINSKNESALTIDGQAPTPLKYGDQVLVSASDHNVMFVRVQTPDYFYRNLTSRMSKNPSAGASS